ncbi:MAG TPA: SDR family NAD(P)-dependent oxidoreductase [Mycobacteriales bacterium]|nr:SDR family NAD(P)-dependent oxidoreductase [Mycobacteriales bacterium]
MSRVAVVTGAGAGIGAAICALLSRAGHGIAALDRDAQRASSTAAAITASGGRAIALPVDVVDRDAVDLAYARVRAELGPIEIVVTSAAASGFVPFVDLTEEEWDRTLRVNLTGTFHCLQAAIGDMVAAGWGRIVTISSAAGQIGSVRQAHYAASKGGVIALTKTLALEHAVHGITANTIPPFTVDTPMLRTAQADGHLPAAEHIARMIPARRLGHVDDIAAMCAFLCSDAAGYVNGQVIGVNGGAVT